MPISTSWEEAINSISWVRMIQKPFVGCVADIAEVLHMRGKFGGGLRCCNFPQKCREVFVFEGRFEVFFKMLEAVPMGSERENVRNSVNEALLTVGEESESIGFVDGN